MAFVLGLGVILLTMQSCALSAGTDDVGGSAPAAPDVGATHMPQEPDMQPQDIHIVAAMCLTCHGRPGVTASGALADIPTLHGRSAAYMLQRLYAFRGERSAQATVMPQLVRALDDAQLHALAQWFAAQHEATP